MDNLLTLSGESGEVSDMLTSMIDSIDHFLEPNCDSLLGPSPNLENDESGSDSDATESYEVPEPEESSYKEWPVRGICGYRYKALGGSKARVKLQLLVDWEGDYEPSYVPASHVCSWLRFQYYCEQPSLKRLASAIPLSEREPEVGASSTDGVYNPVNWQRISFVIEDLIKVLKRPLSKARPTFQHHTTIPDSVSEDKTGKDDHTRIWMEIPCLRSDQDRQTSIHF